ncbi:hypothetical protein D3C83_88830 [compost metagenome]
MNEAMASMHACTPHCIAARLGALTARISASTAICWLARNTAAPPMNEKATIMITEAGSGHCSGSFIT